MVVTSMLELTAPQASAVEPPEAVPWLNHRRARNDGRAGRLTRSGEGESQEWSRFFGADSVSGWCGNR